MSRNPAPTNATQTERRAIWRAHKAAERAITRGVLHRPNGTEMHHPSYGAPLDVEYLTPAEHKRRHMMRGNPLHNASDWQLFSTSILRSLPQGSSKADYRAAMRRAGELWRQGNRRHNPSPIAIPREIEIPWLVVGAVVAGVYLLGRMGSPSLPPPAPR